MTPQEIFDTVAKHLFTQGKPAKQMMPDPDNVDGEDSQCRYRAADGTKCAVGVLLPDELYVESMEGQSLSGLIMNAGKQGQPELPSWMEENASLLMDLQSAHDSDFYWETTKKMRKRLADIAKDRGGDLDTNVLATLSFSDGR
jgi:hypothetical protein